MKLSKTSIIAAACLGALALTGVGFAGWYIVSDAGETKTGNITVYDITNNAVVISAQKWINKAVNTEEEIKGVKDGAAVIFGSPKDATTHSPENSYSWFGFDSKSEEGKTVVEAECFPVYSFTLTDYSNSTKDPVVTATLKISNETTGDDYQKMLGAYYTCLKGNSTNSNKTYITGPDLVEQVSDQTTTYKAKDASLKAELSKTSGTDSTSRVYTVTIDFGFGWGNNFIPTSGDTAVNPYYYYGALINDNSNVENANKAMGTIANLKGLTYSLEITAKPGSSNNNNS